MNIRNTLTADLRTHLPKKWRISNSQANPDTLDRTYLRVTQQSIGQAPQAPRGAYQFSFELTLISAITDLQKAEDDLDDTVEELIWALDAIPYLTWSPAEKVLFDGSNVGYSLTVTVGTTKTQKDS